MPQPSSISRRIASCIAHANARDYEAALIDYFPALDKTAKRRRPKAGVGDRIRKFIADQEGIISSIATGNYFKDISFNDLSFPEAIYKFGRTPIAHEGELDPRLQFNDAGVLEIGHVWNLPSRYIPALCVAVMVAPENAQEFIPTPNLAITLFGRRLDANELWGAEEMIKHLISDAFRRPDLFGKVA